jgi:hypothetical protein
VRAFHVRDDADENGEQFVEDQQAHAGTDHP